MAEDDSRKPVKTGVHEGGGPTPGYQWNVDILDQAYREAESFLDGEQYAHVSRQFRELARETAPTQSCTVDVQPFGDFFEFRDKGGLLKKINVRVYFAICHKNRTIVVLGAMNKKNDGQTPSYVHILMRYRMRQYQATHSD